MRVLPFTTLLAAWTGVAAAGDLVTKGRIKVQLFAAPSFVSEVSVDANNNQCLSLDNNLYAPIIHPSHLCQGRVLIGGCRIDGRIQSILVGGHDVATVLQRLDYWTCRFFEYVTYPPDSAVKCSANVD